MKSPRIATVLAKVANSPQCGDILCKQYHCLPPFSPLLARLLGNLVLNLWDCGGQEAFMENYFASQRDNIFRNVEVLAPIPTPK